MYLNTHSYYSFRYGTLSTKILLNEAKEAGIKTLVLTDINSTSACLDFVRLAPKYGITPLLGIDFRNGADQLYIGIAKSNEGFKELNTYLSLYLKSKKDIPPLAPAFQEAFVVYPYHHYTGYSLRQNEYVGIHPKDLSKMRMVLQKLTEDKLVIMATASFRSHWDDKQEKWLLNKRDFNIHRLLRAIDNNTLLSKLAKTEEADTNDILLPKQRLLELFKPYSFLIKNTQKLLESCTIHFEFGTDKPHKNQKHYTESTESDYQLLEKLCEEGIPYRYGKPTEEILKRISLELDIIKKKGFMAYFLINWDICRYARSKGYFYVGRGSGANSIVAYLLRITDVDPVELDLYFERFINLFRQNPPDFDIDFSWKDREDITQYMFSRFKHVSLLATYSTFQLRAAMRELGKVLGLPPHEIERVQSTPYDKLDSLGKLVVKYGKWIEGFPSHLSIHAGGILISEQDINYYTATELPPKGFPTVQFDMVIAEDVGLYKFDILSQRGLSKIKESLEIIRNNNPDDPPIDIHDIQKFKQDPKIKTLLREGETVGCFYVESPAMRMLLKKLRVEEYLGLVAASSVIRPGVAQSGMMRQYILRFREPERRKEAHPILLNIMPETYGVMVYQEDVIKVAHYFADLTLGEADVLRRGMSGKYRSREEFLKVKNKFFQNCEKKGIAYEMTTDVWRQIESFAGYAFAKGHSASYAVESYQSLYLKAYYPLEYMVATINNGGGFYRSELYAHEARMKGGFVEAPCINRSEIITTIQGTKIFIGLGFIAQLEAQTAKHLLAQRGDQSFKSFKDFVKRVSISLEQLSLLIKVDAFRSLHKDKKKLLWEAHMLLGNQKRIIPTRTLFEPEIKHFKIPELSYDVVEDAFDQQDLLGFPLCSPFDLLQTPPENSILVKDMIRHESRTVSMLGYLVHIKNTKTLGGKKMQFGTFIDQEGRFLDTTHFPPMASKYPFRGRGIYLLKGKIVEEFDYHSLEIISMDKLAYIQDPRYARMPRHSEVSLPVE